MTFRLLALLATVPLAAQQPRITNAALETRAVTAGLERDFQSLVGGRTSPAWIGYAVPAVAGRHSMCCYGSESCCSGCSLEGRRSDRVSAPGPVSLEAPGYLVVLFRVEQRSVGKIRTFSADCELDAGGLPVYWLTGVQPAESIALLVSLVGTVQDSAIAAIALHAGPAADSALERLVAAGQPEKVRERAAFWLGSARGRRGYEVLRRLVAEDPSDRVREKAVFALSISPEPEALDTVLATARADRSPRVRGQALFWLAQKAGQKAVPAITEAIEKDPETDVKKRAVFALSQLPKDESVRLLIQVARTNRNPEVRKQAMFWLGQSRDPRALDFFEEILGRRP